MMDKSIWHEDFSRPSLAHPGFENIGLGDVAYLRKVFQKNNFIYQLTAANGEVLLEDESRIIIEDFVDESALHVVTVH
ncbi:MAG: hypothetical protein HND56_03870 [Pseudomonadota bacterium]|jgi:hypothetical protein|nr:hypothetical protein [Pseudomonadota bacterium]QKK04879.1 MAG: hypothetical protein HND56_03870 [Pseudomonadota bacterium]